MERKTKTKLKQKQTTKPNNLPNPSGALHLPAPPGKMAAAYLVRDNTRNTVAKWGQEGILWKTCSSIKSSRFYSAVKSKLTMRRHFCSSKYRCCVALESPLQSLTKQLHLLAASFYYSIYLFLINLLVTGGSQASRGHQEKGGRSPWPGLAGGMRGKAEHERKKKALGTPEKPVRECTSIF